MRLTKLLMVGISLLGCPLSGCQTSDVKPEQQSSATAPLANKSGQKFGAALSSAPVVSLSDIVQRQTEFAGKVVKTEGEVKAVCKSAGCWMEIEGAEGRAHIKMVNHSFFMPKDCTGKRALVEGTVQAGAPKNECGSKDSCGGEEHGAVAKVELVATGVELLD